MWRFLMKNMVTEIILPDRLSSRMKMVKERGVSVEIDP